MTQHLANTLPAGWQLVPFTSVVTMTKGKKPKDLGEQSAERSIPYIDIHAFETGNARKFSAADKAVTCKEDDVLLVWDGARSGLTGIGAKGVVGSTIMKVESDEVHHKYLYHFLQSKYNHLNTNTRGVGIPHIDPLAIKSLLFPVAPMDQQESIVQTIDFLFASLDSGLASMRHAERLLTQYRQSVLDSATSGMLTENWRETNSRHPNLVMDAGLPNGWARVPLGEVVQTIQKIRPQDNPKEEILYLDIGGIDRQSNTVSSFKRYSGEDAPSRAQQVIKEGDVAFATVRPYLRNIAVVPQGLDGQVGSTGFCFLRPVAAMSSEYLFYCVMATRFVDRLSQLQKGSSYPAVTNQQVLECTILLPPLEEQQQIVSSASLKLAAANRLLERIRHHLMRAEQCKKAILATAFCGNLT